VVPFIRPYRTQSDVGTWFSNPEIYALVQTEYRRGIYRGIGEFHVFGKSAAGEWVKKVVDFSVEHDLYLHAHCDEEALLILFGHNPRAKIIWAHTGFTTPPARIAELFAQYPALWAELSYHSGIVGGAGQLTPAWRDLFGRYSERFLIGSDTWIDQRWTQYDDLSAGIGHGWRSFLPIRHATSPTPMPSACSAARSANRAAVARRDLPPLPGLSQISKEFEEEFLLPCCELDFATQTTNRTEKDHN
jgi:hypothetical protein